MRIAIKFFAFFFVLAGVIGVWHMDFTPSGFIPMASNGFWKTEGAKVFHFGMLWALASIVALGMIAIFGDWGRED